ncbi:MAG: hypothetical protein CFE44_18790 [Burkholderiales bacterium PBB4]|nr:MAG: hypothetical protein CFE44_18790 [Burkholderiales bacterium PBB4]
MPKKKEEPPFWLTVLKLVVIATVLIGGTGFALWYIAEHQKLDDPAKPAVTPSSSWGIANDSPIRPKR